MKSDSYEILINNDCLLTDIQRNFSAHYPFLKLEFPDSGKNIKPFSSIKQEATLHNKIINLAEPCRININGHRTVSQVSNDFHILLGMIVQLFRKSGTVWNLISLTNEWTLESQNTAGEYICSVMAKGPL